MRLALLSLAVVSWCLTPVALVSAQSSEQLRQQLEEIQRKIEAAQLRESEKPDRRATVIGSSRSRVKDEWAAAALVTRLYDLSDLFTVAPPYVATLPNLIGPDEEIFQSTTQGPLGNGGRLSGSGMGGMGGMGGGMGGMGGGMFAVPTLPPQKELAKTLNQMSDQGNASGLRTSMDQLMEVIKTTIRPDEWKGGESRIAVIGASLVVTATDDAHQQISALLDLFRQRWGSLKTVSLRAWWLWLDEDELSDALEPARGATAMFGAVSDGAWKKLRKLATDGNRRGYSSAVTCYNGQTVFTLAGDQRLAVTGLTPVFGTDEKSSGVAYEPLVTAVHNGAVLQVTPLATRNGKYVVLDIHSRVNLVDKNSAPPRAEAVPAGDPRQVAQAIGRPSLQSQRISTTLRVPVQQVTLVGGMTFGAAENRNLYLFVQGSIQELRDDDDRSAAPKIEVPKGSAGATAAPRAPSTEKPSIDDEKPSIADGKPALDTEKPSIDDEPSAAAEAPKAKAKARSKKPAAPAPAPAPSDSPFDP